MSTPSPFNGIGAAVPRCVSVLRLSVKSLSAANNFIIHKGVPDNQPVTSQPARVVEILISTGPSAPMQAQESALAVPGKGLQGDRYFEGVGTFSRHPPKPDYEVTLVEREKIAAFAAASGLPFTSHLARRNIVTQGVDLNSLVGREFRIGEALLRGIRLCEPCTYLAKTTFPEVLHGLVHKGGLRAQVVSGGVIRVGDEIVWNERPEG